MVGIELVTVSAFVRVASFETWDRDVASTERRRHQRVRRDATPADATASHRVRRRCEDG